MSDPLTLIAVLVVLITLFMGVTGALWKFYVFFSEKIDQLGDKIDGLVLVERQDISELTLTVHKDLGGLKDDVHEGFAQNAIQHTQMAGRMDVLDEHIKTLYKKVDD